MTKAELIGALAELPDEADVLIEPCPADRGWRASEGELYGLEVEIIDTAEPEKSRLRSYPAGLHAPRCAEVFLPVADILISPGFDEVSALLGTRRPERAFSSWTGGSPILD